METATVIEVAALVKSGRKSRVISTRLSLPDLRSGRLLLAKIVDELDQVDGRIPILGRRRMEALLLAVGQPVESGLVPGRRLNECLGDGGLQFVGKIGTIRVHGWSNDRRRLVDDPEVFL